MMSYKLQGQTNVLSLKVKWLEDQKTKLQSVVEFINSVLTDGSQWTSSQEQIQNEFPETRQTIEKAVTFVAQKCLEISSANGEDSVSLSQSVLNDEKKSLLQYNDVIHSLLTRLAVVEETIKSTQNGLTSNGVLTPDVVSKLKPMDQSMDISMNTSCLKQVFSNGEDLENMLKIQLDLTSSEPGWQTGIVGQFIDQLQSQVDDINRTVASFKEETEAIAKSVVDSKQTLESLNTRTLRLVESLDSYEIRGEGQQSSRYDEIVKDLSLKFEILASQVQHVKSRNTDNDVASNRPAFTAFICGYSPVEHGANIRSFTDVRCNFGGHFDVATGEFTAPVSGVYAVSLTLWLLKEGRVKVNVVNTSADGLREHKVCEAYTCGANISSNSFGVAEMQVGSRLSVKLVFMTGNGMLSDFSSFSCFRVG